MGEGRWLWPAETAAAVSLPLGSERAFLAIQRSCSLLQPSISIFFPPRSSAQTPAQNSRTHRLRALVEQHKLAHFCAHKARKLKLMGSLGFPSLSLKSNWYCRVLLLCNYLKIVRGKQRSDNRCLAPFKSPQWKLNATILVCCSWELALLEGTTVSLKHIGHKQMHVSFVKALIKSLSLPFMWVCCCWDRGESSRSCFILIHTGSLAAWARGHCPCIHVRARDRDRSHRQGWKAPPSHKRSRLSPVGCRERRLQKCNRKAGIVFSERLSVSQACSVPQISHISGNVSVENGCP